MLCSPGWAGSGGFPRLAVLSCARLCLLDPHAAIVWLYVWHKVPLRSAMPVIPADFVLIPHALDREASCTLPAAHVSCMQAASSFCCQPSLCSDIQIHAPGEGLRAGEAMLPSCACDRSWLDSRRGIDGRPSGGAKDSKKQAQRKRARIRKNSGSQPSQRAAQHTSEAPVHTDTFACSMCSLPR